MLRAAACLAFGANAPPNPVIPLAILGGMLVVLTPLIMWSIHHQRAAFEDLRRIWTEYGRRRGLEWKAVGGPWYRKTPSGIEGVLDGTDVQVGAFRVMAGKVWTTNTRATVEMLRSSTRATIGLPRASGIVLCATRRGFLNGLGEKLGRAPVRSGDSSFDDAVFLRAIDETRALRIVDREVRGRLARFPRKFWLEVKDGTASLAWRDVERDPAVLDAALSIVASMARALRG